MKIEELVPILEQFGFERDKADERYFRYKRCAIKCDYVSNVTTIFYNNYGIYSGKVSKDTVRALFYFLHADSNTKQKIKRATKDKILSYGDVLAEQVKDKEENLRFYNEHKEYLVTIRD